MYDQYHLRLTDFQVIAFDFLEDYKRYKAEKSMKIIKDFSLSMTFCNSLEPKHPKYPSYEIKMSLDNMNIVASDYIAIFGLKT